jgi:hypothetical protein
MRAHTAALVVDGDARDCVWLSFEQGDAMASINVGDENSSPIEIMTGTSRGADR